MILRTIFEFMAIVLVLIGFKHEDFLIDLEHAIYVRTKHYLKARRAKNGNA